MIGNSLSEYLFIRVSIAALRLVAPVSILYLAVGAWSATFPFSRWLGGVAIAEAAFYLLVFRPRRERLQVPSKDPPPPLTKPQRQALFSRCSSNIDSTQQSETAPYPTGWFLPPNTQAIRREDAVDWLLWALFSSNRENAREEWTEELNEYLVRIEEMLGRKLEDGRGEGVKSMRLTLDPVKTLHRPLLWYSIVGCVDACTNMTLLFLGFKHYSSPKWFQMFPPRPFLTLLSRRAAISPDILLPYWYRPHKSIGKLPILFIHGIGIGLYPYIQFFRDIISRDPDVGILLIELLPISMHITAQPIPPRFRIIKAINDILTSLDIERVVLVAHSYGTYVSAYILRPPTHHPTNAEDYQQHRALASKVVHTILIDPIAILLHLHSVAYNFVYREPRRAAEWQLWYFASRDPDVGRTIGRAFFWAEGGLWREDLERFMQGNLEEGESKNLSDGEGESERLLERDRGRNLAIVLAENDQIVPAEAVRRYLTGEREPSARWLRRGWSSPSSILPAAISNHQLNTHKEQNGCGDELATGFEGGQLEILFYLGLDHATVFDTKERRKGIVDILERFARG